MRDFAKIYTALWDSEKFNKLMLEDGEPDDDARLLYLYLQTCKHCNSVGCFRLKPGYATDDLKWPEKRYRDGIDTLCRAGLIRYSAAKNVVLIVDFLSHTAPSNAKHALSLFGDVAKIPCEELKTLIGQELTAIVDAKKYTNDRQVGYSIDTLCKPYRYIEIEIKIETEIKMETKTEIKTEIEGRGSARAAIIEAAAPNGAASMMPFESRDEERETQPSPLRPPKAGPSPALVALANAPPIRDPLGLVAMRARR